MRTRRELTACILAGTLLACETGEVRSFVDNEDYYRVAWGELLGGAPADTVDLNFDSAQRLTVASQHLLFPLPAQDSLDAILGGGRDAQELPDGRWLVLGTEGYLLLGDSLGTAHVLAREGEGPGELDGPEWLKVLPDGRIAVWDGLLLRLSWFDPDSGFIASHRVSLTELGARRVYPLAISGADVAIARVRDPYPAKDGVYLNRADVMTLDSLGAPTAVVLHSAPFSERHLQTVPGPSKGSRGVAMFTPPFARSGDVLAGNAKVCYVWTGAAEFACRSMETGRWQLVRDPGPGRQVTEAYLQVLMDSVYLIGVAAARQKEQETSIRKIPTADSMPRWGRAYLDTDDILWLPRYATIPEPVQEVLLVDGGTVRASFALPRQDRIRWALGRRVIVERRSPDGVHQFYEMLLSAQNE